MRKYISILLSILINVNVNWYCYSATQQQYYNEFKSAFDNLYAQKSFRVKLRIETGTTDFNFLNCNIKSSVIPPNKRAQRGFVRIGNADKLQFEAILIENKYFERYKTGDKWGKWNKVSIKKSKRQLFDEKTVINDLLKNATFVSKEPFGIKFTVKSGVEKLIGKIFIDRKRNLLTKFVVKNKNILISINYFDINSKNIKIIPPVNK